MPYRLIRYCNTAKGREKKIGFMGNSGIAKIVTIEKEIQEKIEAEKLKAEQWLGEIKKKTEEDLVRIEEKIKRTNNERLLLLEEEIRNNARTIIEEAVRWHQWVINLKEDELKAVLLKFITRIIPDVEKIN